MELRQLRYFLVLAEELSFSRAARRLYIAQPSLSQQIRQLETELDTVLFDRSVRPIRLTNAGQVLLGDAYSLVSDAEITAREVKRAGRGEVGRLRIGYSYGGLYDLVLALLRRLRTAWPEANMAIHQLPQREQLPALRTGRVDVVLGRLTEPVTPDVIVRPLREERLIAILPADHPRAGGATVDLAALSAEPLPPVDVSPTTSSKRLAWWTWAPMVTVARRPMSVPRWASTMAPTGARPASVWSSRSSR